MPTFLAIKRSAFVTWGVAGLGLALSCAANDQNDEVCVRALDKLENDCPGSDVTVQGSGDVDCSGQVRCVLECVDAASCEEIQNPDGTDYQSCREGCG